MEQKVILQKCIDVFNTEIDTLQVELSKLDAEIAALTRCRNIFNAQLTELEEDDYLASQYEDEEEYSTFEYNLPSTDPEYIVASTSHIAQETYIFESNPKGERTNSYEYGGLALRWGNADWESKQDAVKACFPSKYYKLIKEWSWECEESLGSTALYKKEEAPDEFTHFDGDESDRISY